MYRVEFDGFTKEKQVIWGGEGYLSIFPTLADVQEAARKEFPEVTPANLLIAVDGFANGPDEDGQGGTCEDVSVTIKLRINL